MQLNYPVYFVVAFIQFYTWITAPVIHFNGIIPNPLKTIINIFVIILFLKQSPRLVFIFFKLKYQPLARYHVFGAFLLCNWNELCLFYFIEDHFENAIKFYIRTSVHPHDIITGMLLFESYYPIFRYVLQLQ